MKSIINGFIRYCIITCSWPCKSYVHENSQWLGSVIVCPTLYSHFCENKIIFTMHVLIVFLVNFHYSSPTASHMWYNILKAKRFKMCERSHDAHMVLLTKNKIIGKVWASLSLTKNRGWVHYYRVDISQFKIERQRKHVLFSFFNWTAELLIISTLWPNNWQTTETNRGNLDELMFRISRVSVFMIWFINECSHVYIRK